MKSERPARHDWPFRGERGSAALEAIPADLLAAVVAFLRDWLPAQAKDTYRRMITEDPDHWHRHPHFAGGVIAEHALRGNGITEKVLGVKDMEEVWPALLELAVAEDTD
jgi:hypothetical protein